jgi:hypothetical protein
MTEHDYQYRIAITTADQVLVDIATTALATAPLMEAPSAVIEATIAALIMASTSAYSAAEAADSSRKKALIPVITQI